MSGKFMMSLVALPLLAVLAGCAGNDAMLKRMDELESKVEGLNDKVSSALRNSASAKVDAATAMHIVTQ